MHNSERRELRRWRCNWPAVCVTNGGESYPVAIVDASANGLGISGWLPIIKGEQISISLKQIGFFLCEVAWKKDDRCGVRLLPEDGHLSHKEIAELANTISKIERPLQDK